MITYDKLKLVSRYSKAFIVQGIVDNQQILEDYEIIEGPRRQMFLAQLAHESDGFKTTREYASGAGYEGRRDLGNTEEGDGRRFRGRGLIQLTGRANYKKYGDMLGLDLTEDPDQVELFPLALTVSVLYWDSHGLNGLADEGDFERITRKINGGLNGLESREAYLAKIEELDI